MDREQRLQKKHKNNPRKSDQQLEETRHHSKKNEINELQQKIGNRAMQRLIAQHNQHEPTRLDEELSQRIQQTRSSGEALPANIQSQMEQGLNADFSQVRVHTSSESHALNQTLGAKAFTTGKDIFFKQGAYDPHTSSGKELLAHELTHVVQQGSGQVNKAGSGLTVNAPGDRFEKEADQTAKTLLQSSNLSGDTMTPAGQIQRETEPTSTLLQRQAEDNKEEEEEIQMQQDEDEEEKRKKLEEEEIQTKRG